MASKVEEARSGVIGLAGLIGWATQAESLDLIPDALDALIAAVREDERERFKVVGAVPVDDSGQPWLQHADYSPEAVRTDLDAMAHCKVVAPLYVRSDET